MSVWVKICGIVRGADAEAAIRFGADALGVNFHPASKRFCSVEEARAVVAQVGGRVPVYGVFVDRTREQIADIMAATGIDAVQLHGHEPIELTTGWSVPVLRAVGGASSDDLNTAVRLAAAPASGHRLLIDHASGGGSGRRVDEDVLRGVDLGEVVLAGGLTPTNIAATVERLSPWGVDCAGGVEAAPGRKDARALEEFIVNAKSVNATPIPGS